MRNFTRHFHLDFETFSEADIKTGIKNYASHPSTEILLAAYAYDDDPVDLYDIAEFCRMADEDGDDGTDASYCEQSARQEIEDACNDPDVLLIAWNAPFEREILRHVWGIETPAEKWLDAMVVSYSMSLPGSLGEASKVLNLPDDKAKQATGRRLIQKFCKPQPKNQKLRRRDWESDPDDWELFGGYCVGDVEAERAGLKRMWKYRPPEHEIDLWHLDQRINERGAPIDLELVEAAQFMADEIKADLKRECAILTGLTNPNSREQFLGYIQGEGFVGDSLAKDKVEIALRGDDISEEGRAALELRAQFSKNSTAKYKKIEAQTVDGQLCYTLQYAGAGRTWRWAGRGAQFHNLPRPPKVTKTPEAMATALDIIKSRDPEFMRLMYDNPVDVLAGAIRPTLRAPEGKRLIISDYNAIENRVLGWVAQCDAILDVFRHDLDPYKDFALKMFHQFHGTPEHPEYMPLYKTVDGEQRTNSKPAVLGAGYMLGGGRLVKDRRTGLHSKTGLWAYAEALGVELSQEQSKYAVDTFRESYPEVVEFWDTIDNVVRKVINKKPENPIEIPVGFSGQCLRIGYLKPFLFIELPSGRRLWYMRPRVERAPMPWENDDGSQAYGMAVTYEGLNQTTNKWCRVQTHKGKLTENVVQAMARDVLANGIIRATDAGFTVVLHVHDEVVCVEDIVGDNDVETLNRALCQLPDWCHDLPMRAEGFESPFYVKD